MPRLIAANAGGLPLCAVLCNGKSCRGDAREQLSAELRAAGVPVVSSRCLKVCHGPVAVVPVGGRWRVIERIRGRKTRARVLGALRRQRTGRIRRQLVRGGDRRVAIRRAPLP